ncbi:MAG: hypothetical protein HDS64_01060 [Bacteroidales bacterium]|nr:hypothetical protein [Bacteroidales bacterium]MBD5282523.1 hypothetical protein [Bacteroides sp.]
MKAIKITVFGAERVKLGDFVSYLNTDEELAATLVSKDTAFIAAAGERAMAYALTIANNRFSNFEIENLK